MRREEAGEEHADEVRRLQNVAGRTFPHVWKVSGVKVSFYKQIVFMQFTTHSIAYEQESQLLLSLTVRSSADAVFLA